MGISPRVTATLDNLAIMATVELFEANFAEFGEMYFFVPQALRQEIRYA
jgi:hypothetical protein